MGHLDTLVGIALGLLLIVAMKRRRSSYGTRCSTLRGRSCAPAIAPSIEASPEAPYGAPPAPAPIVAAPAPQGERTDRRFPQSPLRGAAVPLAPLPPRGALRARDALAPLPPLARKGQSI
ncbi:MAG: hypothetical protein PXZ07_06415 [Candidatus Eremiobacteraeota bacterium]|nr:hypothetical protein [Candidatus Eremiobacteraeota bacterium]